MPRTAESIIIPVGSAAAASRRKDREVQDILNWLQTQPGGIATYVAFNERVAQLLQSEPDNAAAARLLGQLTGRFVEAFEREPLPSSVDRAAIERLKQWLERLVAVQQRGADDRLALLNELAVAELS